MSTYVFGGLSRGCHPMFANPSSNGITARSFGGLRMTFNLEGRLQTQLKVFVILRPPNDLAVLFSPTGNICNT
ncbi:MAG: hypothetical protein RL151_646 [Bacteroidota bacterium]|jgi:hypothetical protein